jgi:hypothetical protein
MGAQRPTLATVTKESFHLTTGKPKGFPMRNQTRPRKGTNVLRSPYEPKEEEEEEEEGQEPKNVN